MFSGAWIWRLEEYGVCLKRTGISFEGAFGAFFGVVTEAEKEGEVGKGRGGERGEGFGLKSSLGGSVVQSVAMVGFYLVEVLYRRFSHAAEVFFYGSAQPAMESFSLESLLLTFMNNLMFGILLVAVVYILAHFLLTAVIVSRLFLVGCWMIFDGSPWLSVPVEWLVLLNKQCPKFIQNEKEGRGECSVCLESFDIGCVKRKLKCGHEFHAG